jgi:hypothetical protein
MRTLHARRGSSIQAEIEQSMAKIIDAFSAEELWKRRTRISARLRLAELGCPDDVADLLIADLLGRAETPAAALNASQIQDYYSRIVVGVVDILWASYLKQQNQPTTLSS